jgi:glycosyltransferase involved in cell wall biosynthesis
MNIGSDPNPLVSIVMPVFNGARTLRNALESVVSQTYINFECIILDNSSGDETGLIGAEFASRDSRFRCVRNPAVLPIMANHNAVVVRMSDRASYCQILHADDMLESACLQKKVALAERHPSVGLVASYSLWGNKRFPVHDVPFNDECLPGREAGARVLRDEFYPFLSPSSVMLRADLVRARGKLYNECVLHGDVQAAYELLEQSDFGFVHEVLVRVGRSAQSVTSRVIAPLSRNLAANLELLLTYGPRFLDPDEFERSVNARLEDYYANLACAALEGRSREYWKFHGGALHDCGRPLRLARLFRAVASQIRDRPRPSVHRVLSRFRSSRR